MTIILEDKSSNNSESQQIHARLIYGIVGLKQSPNFLSMRLVQLINNIKVSSKSIFKILSYILYLQNTFEKYVYLVTSRYLKKYLAQHWKRSGRVSNLRPHGCRSDALTTTPPRHNNNNNNSNNNTNL